MEARTINKVMVSVFEGKGLVVVDFADGSRGELYAGKLQGMNKQEFEMVKAVSYKNGKFFPYQRKLNYQEKLTNEMVQVYARYHRSTDED